MGRAFAAAPSPFQSFIVSFSSSAAFSVPANLLCEPSVGVVASGSETVSAVGDPIVEVSDILV